MRTQAPARRKLRSDYARVAIVVAGLFAALSFVERGVSGRALVGALFSATLVILAAYDLEHRIIPNRIVLPAAGVVFVLQVALFPDRGLEWTLAALGSSGFLLIMLLAYPAGLGMGDVKLCLLLGAALGNAVVMAMILGLLAASMLGVILLLSQGASARKKVVPLGPFLAFGGIAALFLS
jgi:leader peptidase (prepilin peptidase)/N-methyltransferase